MLPSKIAHRYDCATCLQPTVVRLTGTHERALIGVSPHALFCCAFLTYVGRQAELASCRCNFMVHGLHPCERARDGGQLAATISSKSQDGKSTHGEPNHSQPSPDRTTEIPETARTPIVQHSWDPPALLISAALTYHAQPRSTPVRCSSGVKALTCARVMYVYNHRSHCLQ